MFQNELKKAMQAIGISLTEKQITQYTLFFEALVETNKVMNLTALTSSTDVAWKHIADSLSCYDERYFLGHKKVLDLGSGAGFPGVPLFIYNPDLEITFFDSLQKRLYFIESVIQRLSEQQLTYLHGRAEDMAHQEGYREAFDIVTSRAVARLPILAEWCLPYVKKGGYMIALKGAQYEAEIKEAQKAIEILGGMIEEVRPVQLGQFADKRAIIYIRKIASAPKKYPRKPKVAAKNPL
ncbi:16S rRNA (guanine(527)-N(7))-methyltransferase RsmG [Veillonellaceae bacterium M2-8]|uniref:16S rRNA (guanine(527)-N(7))-methyltransferase RsmG n=1 Tax=uncultured Megasphaera sp. TaxID=165188 RepID=UPI0012E146BC|nr:16S rRNA (guanine(527)-N(7))-methyltransferase RsmG [uncultured Megasphaera sp.]MUP48030.1 16S rRNA (guanine(527)-N(7))-methyltransferase RsmG [Veillonellaceae bacterium M2-8]